MDETKAIIPVSHYTDNDQINQLLSRLVSEVKGFTENQLDQIRRLNQIGTALSAERNLDRLLEMIVDQARDFTNADGGTLYIMSDDETELQFAIVQNTSLNIRMGGTGGKITWPSVKLRNPDGSPNHANVSAYSAITGKVVNIADVYHAEGFNFEGTRKFDAETGYRSMSMLVVPMRNHENDIIGILQLLNAHTEMTDEVISFSIENQKMTESLASQAAIALSNNRLIHDLENLLESFIRTIATAIDEKSPYTGGHVRRVAELTMTIAEKINDTKEGTFAGIHFDEDKLKELRISAWLHDVGKITTPEFIIDKARKLETIYDRLEAIKIRFEILKRDYLLTTIKKSDVKKKRNCNEKEIDNYDKYVEQLEADYRFIEEINTGSTFMDEKMNLRLNNIAATRWNSGGNFQNLLYDDELYNLRIPQGTLTSEEKEIIKNHVTITHKMLSQLPFPKKLKNVAHYASAHHEKLDGTGYPLGIKDSEIPLQARIIALADIFDALTAKDRPYKKEKTLSEAIKIMDYMVKENYIDADLFELFNKERIYLDYAKRELTSHQIDMT
ncbi:MAG TPA: metal-dependent phosphohydrolase [Syntrophaceae bacterium]|jgi:HD-GYP domain-containing protein (c-di-GMP phosphodiesterase class II)|nr:metal-dependent phosphohydrolase [Syntrophaceae bacterium]